MYRASKAKQYAGSRVPLSQASTMTVLRSLPVARGRAYWYMRVTTAGHLGLKNHSNVFPHRIVKDVERGYLLGLPAQAAKAQANRLESST